MTSPVPKPLEGRVAIVTGGANGIGRSIALKFAQNGARILIADLDPTVGEAVAARCGSRSMALQVDVRRPESIEQMVATTIDRFGQIDILVNCAGIFGRTAPLLEIPWEEWDQVFAVNTRGTFCCLQAAARVMTKQGRGTIINMSSIAAKGGRSDFAQYNASKAAILSLTWTAATELAPFGVTVNAICPGPVDTELWAKFGASRAAALGLDPVEVRRRREAEVPLGRFAWPEEVADVALFLASPAASYLTGISIDVAGGAHNG